MIKPAIVIVDAFPQELRELVNDLEQKYSDRFRIIEATSGQQALNQLKQMSLHNEPVALVLVDEQMPEMNGSEFLQEARSLFPTAKRILLITYADTHAAMQAISRRRYFNAASWLSCRDIIFLISKPSFVNRVLRASRNQAIRTRKVLTPCRKSQEYRSN